MSNNGNIVILEKLNPADLRRDDKNFETAGALFLTYSIENKTVITGLMTLFDIPEEEENNKGEKQKLNIKQRWEKLRRFHSRQWQQERVGFVCNDGYDKSTGSPLSFYTEGFIAHYKIPENEPYYSFHPKLYIIRYDATDNNNKETIFRFIIGSMNFVNSANKEFMICFDLKAYKEGMLKGSDEQYTKIDWISTLLGKGEAFRAVGSNISRVINNLGLEKFLFAKGDVPEVLICPGLETVKGSTHIFSPFVTGKYLKENTALELFTMESALKKNGYVRTDDEKSEGARKFWVYEIDDSMKGEKLFSHFKVYVRNETGNSFVYAGSANYTESAFSRNKELLVRLPEGTYDMEGFLKNLRVGYKQYCYKKENTKPKPDIRDLFKNLAVNLGRVLKLHFEEGTVSLVIPVAYSEEQGENQPDAYKNLREKWNQIKKKSNDYSVRISPLYYPSKEIDIDISGKGVKPGNQECWKELDRSKVSQMFTLSLYRDDRKEASDVVCLLFDENSEKSYEKIRALQDALREIYLDRLFSIVSLGDNSMNKEIERLGESINSSAYLKNFRGSFPTLEDMFKKALAEGKDISEVFGMYSDMIKNDLKVAELLSRSGDFEPTQEELKEYAFFDSKLVETLRIQFEGLKKVLTV